jgi:hypothetical protein
MGDCGEEIAVDIRTSQMGIHISLEGGKGALHPYLLQG